MILAVFFSISPLHRRSFDSSSSSYCIRPSDIMAGSGVKYTPPPSPPSPTASFYDVSDDDEDDYNTISHATSRRGVKLLFSKSKVGDIFPSKFLIC